MGEVEVERYRKEKKKDNWEREEVKEVKPRKR